MELIKKDFKELKIYLVSDNDINNWYKIIVVYLKILKNISIDNIYELFYSFTYYIYYNNNFLFIKL